MRRWATRALRVALVGGAAWLLLGAVLRGHARETAVRLESRYGAGCVATLDGPGHAGLLGCRVGALRAGVADVDNLPPDYRLKFEIDAVAATGGEPPRLAVDLFDAEGRPIGTFAGAPETPAHPGSPVRLIGPRLRHPFPVIVGVRPARPGE